MAEPSRAHLELAAGRAEITATAWRPRSPLTRDQWVRVGQTLRTLGNGVQWWVGDWLLAAPRRYGETYGEASRILGYPPETLHNFVWISGAIPPHRRREALSYSHHREVAGLDPAEQDQWLDRAERGSWSAHRLRAEVRRANGLAELDPPEERRRPGRPRLAAGHRNGGSGRPESQNGRVTLVLGYSSESVPTAAVDRVCACAEDQGLEVVRR